MSKQVICQDLKDISLEATPLGGDARMLVNNSNLRLVNLIITAGEQVHEHTAPVEVVFLVLEGSGSVQIDKQIYKISAGQMLICPTDCNRSITADNDENLNLLVVRAPNM